MNIDGINQDTILESTHPGVDRDLLDFLKEVIEFNPKKRLSIDQLLSHKIFEGVSNLDHEIPCPYRVDIKVDRMRLSKKSGKPVEFPLDRLKQFFVDTVLKVQKK